MKACFALALCSVLSAPAAAGSSETGVGAIVVTGATGRTGSALYKLIKSFGAEVRAFVRSADKARTILGCTKCDESEGIYIGDVTKPETLDKVMGAYPKDIDWLGGKAQIEAFAKASVSFKRPTIALCSSMGTTEPNSFLDTLGHGEIGFYKLNLEAFLQASGVRHAIVKPCGLGDDKPAQAHLITGHDDTLPTKKTVAREDVARVMAMALQASITDYFDEDRTVKFQSVRFDLCAGDGAPTKDEDLGNVLISSLQPWQRSSHVVV